MGKGITTTHGVTIGLDVSDRSTEACAIDDDGTWVESWRFATTQTGVSKGLSRYSGARVVLEVGSHSPWMSREIQGAGFEVIVANPRRVRLIAEGDSKSDRSDAEQLARLGRVDPDLLSPIVHRGKEAQCDRILLLAREGMGWDGPRPHSADQPGAGLCQVSGKSAPLEFVGGLCEAGARSRPRGSVPGALDDAEDDRATDPGNPGDG